MAKYATKGEPRSQSATEILSLCVNKLRDTDMATTALRSAMIQVVGERDIGSQETAHMLLGKPLYSSTFSFLCVSLDGSRRVRTGQDENDNQGDEALDPSVLDAYAVRANFASLASVTLLLMRCLCSDRGHWLGSISVCARLQVSLMNHLEEFQ